MPTDPFRDLLDPDRARAEARELIELACPPLRELVNHATHVFVRCSRAADAGMIGRENEDVATFVLYRQLIEQVDGIEVLLSQSCSDAAVPLLRSAFEVTLSLHYILLDEEKYVERSLGWLCGHIHRRIEKYEQVDRATPKGRARAAVLDAFLSEPVTSESSAGAVAALKRVLGRPELEPIDKEFERQRSQTKSKRATDWYSLFGGPPNRRVLAQRTGLEAEYVLLYGEWSDITHASEAAPWIRSGKNPGEGAFLGLRTPNEMPLRAIMAVTFLLRATRLMIGRFRRGEDLSRWYNREVRDAFKALGRVRLKFE